MTDARGDPVALLRSLPVGTRVVIRMRVPGGFTDVLGDLADCTDADCTVRTRRGPTQVPLSAVALAKPVPPPRPGRHESLSAGGS
jgi:hypothetical protein